MRIALGHTAIAADFGTWASAQTLRLKAELPSQCSRQPPMPPPMIAMHGAWSKLPWGTVNRKHKKQVNLRFYGLRIPRFTVYGSHLRLRLRLFFQELAGFVKSRRVDRVKQLRFVAVAKVAEKV
jgi:hypothetical protein